MNIYQNSDNYLRMTNAARTKQGELEKAGYLFSHYERFKEVSDYDKIIYQSRLKQVAEQLIDAQEQREAKFYQALGIKNVAELEEQFFSDAAIANFIGGHFNNIFPVISDALKTVANDGSLTKKINKVTKQQVEKAIEDAFNTDFKQFSQEYQDNLHKIVNGGTLGAGMASVIKAVENRNKTNKMRTGAEISKAALGHWKGELLERCLAMFLAQIGKVSKVELTATDLDAFGRFMKSDVVAKLEDLEIGFQAKNYKWKKDPLTGEITFPNDLSLHSGGSFETFVKRIEALKNQQIAGELQTISKNLRSDNYYYHLINEAVNKTNFSKSEPAQEFLEVVKGLAAAWFGTQLVVDNQFGIAGKNVDFLIISNIGFLPMSVVLRSLYEQGSKLKVSISSTAKINQNEYYERKINAPYTTESPYNSFVKNIGYYAGQEVYVGIKVGAIRLQIVLNNLKTKR